MRAEERSFAPAPASMGELKAPNLFGLTPEERDAALFQMMLQVHGCVEEGIAKAAKENRAVSGKVDRTRKDVKALQDGQRVIMVALGIREPEEGEDRPEVRLTVNSRAHVTTRDIGRIVAAVLGGMGGLVLLLQICAPGVAAIWEAIMKANT